MISENGCANLSAAQKKPTGSGLEFLFFYSLFFTLFFISIMMEILK